MTREWTPGAPGKRGQRVSSRGFGHCGQIQISSDIDLYTDQVRRASRKLTRETLRFIIPIAVVATAVGWSTTGSAATPSPEQLVPNTVARVSDVPKQLGTITSAEFHHALAQAAAAVGRRRVPAPGGRGYRRLKHAAIDTLLEAIWLKGQAMEMHIRVTHKQVVRARASVKSESFKSAAEYREFLREARYTSRDVYERIELQLLSVRIQRRIEKRVKDKSEEQKVFREFVTEFNERWRGRTVCATGYVMRRCSNGPTSSG